jgi:sugar phosphate permease
MLGTTVALAIITIFLVPNNGFIPAYWLLALILLLSGAFGGCVNGASGRAVMGWFPKNKRGFAISLRVAAVPMGGAIGAALLPFLALTTGFRGVFCFLTIFSLLATLAVILWLDEPPLIRIKDLKNSSISGITNPLLRWDIWRVAITAFLLDLPQFAVLTFGSVFLHTVEQIPLKTIVILLVIIQVAGGLSRVISGKWTDLKGGRYRRRIVRVYSWLIAIGFTFIALYMFVPQWLIVLAFVITGSLTCGWHGVHYAEIATMAGAERSGTALGLENTMVFGGAFVAPLLISATLQVASWSVVMLAICVIPAIASALLMPPELVD